MATLGRFARAVTAGERVPAPELGNNEIGDLGRALASMREQPDGKPLPLEQGIGDHLPGGGLHAALAPTQSGQRLAFGISLQSNLDGTESLAIVPIADNNHISLRSSWPHPQFTGRFLPRSQRIGADGFQAQWDISSLAAGSQAQYLQEDDKAWLDSLQLGLVEPVNIYSQADRASKYGILTTRWCWAR